MPQIVFEQVTKIYDGEDLVLEDVSFSIEKGEFVFLIGKSGVGKSSVLKLLSRQETASAGKVLIDGENIGLLKAKEIPYFRRKLGIMQADMKCLQDRTVYDNILLALRSSGYALRKSKGKIMEALGSVGMAAKAGFYPQELSVGEEARVLLARALVTDPQILLADEPTANLDADRAWDMMGLLDEVNRKGVTVIVSCHSIELVNIMHKRVLTLVEGMLVSDEKHAGYNLKALDIFEERRIRKLREEKNRQKK